MTDQIKCPDCGSTDIALPPDNIPAKDVLCLGCGWQFNADAPITSDEAWETVEDNIEEIMIEPQEVV